MSQFLGIFASLSLFGFCLPNPSELVGMQHRLCVGRQLRDPFSLHVLTAAASLLSGWGFQLETWSFLFQEKSKYYSELL